MNRAMRRGLWVAAVHVAIVASLGGKLLLDRATRPRVWARAAPVDPDLPIRGRYVSLRLEALPAAGVTLRPSPSTQPMSLAVQDGRLVASPASPSSITYARPVERDGQLVAVISPPVAFFIPEHVRDPSFRAPGEELWVEVTLPARGAPRPIRLGVKKGGVLEPL